MAVRVRLARIAAKAAEAAVDKEQHEMRSGLDRQQIGRHKGTG